MPPATPSRSRSLSRGPRRLHQPAPTLLLPVPRLNCPLPPPHTPPQDPDSFINAGTYEPKDVAADSSMDVYLVNGNVGYNDVGDYAAALLAYVKVRRRGGGWGGVGWGVVWVGWGGVWVPTAVAAAGTAIAPDPPPMPLP